MFILVSHDLYFNSFLKLEEQFAGITGLPHFWASKFKIYIYICLLEMEPADTHTALFLTTWFQRFMKMVSQEKYCSVLDLFIKVNIFLELT
jgi:hypothetical protein